MKQSIFITGVSGSGKSTLGKRLRELGYSAYDIESVAGMFTATDTRTGKILKEWDPNNLEDMKNMRFVCSRETLDTLIRSEQNDVSFYCGTATNVEEIIDLFDKVVLLQSSPETVRHRLLTRTTHNFARTPEMQDWILSIKGPFEKSLIDRGAIAIDADGDVGQTVSKVLDLCLN